MPEAIVSARPGSACLDAPGERECLRCYLGRMLVRHGCDNTRRWTIRWRARRAPGDERLLDELAGRGGICCDCEVVMNVWEAGCEYENDSAGTPPCPGVGSRNPLDLCVRWSGLSLRDPHYGYDSEEECEEQEQDYNLL
jgi:Protein of unknown function (DUF2695)